MSQATTWGVQSAGPATMAQYAVRDNAALDALLSGHRGSSRPSYAVASTIWVNAGTAPVTDAEIYYFDGTNDILIATVNENTNAVTFTGLGTAAVLDVGTSADNVVQLNGSAQLPAVDGSLLTGIGGTEDQLARDMAMTTFILLDNPAGVTGPIFGNAFTSDSLAISTGATYDAGGDLYSNATANILVSGATGTSFGPGFTIGGGLAAAFDGTTVQARAASAEKAAAAGYVNFVGKVYSPAKTIVEARAYSPSDSAFLVSQIANLKLQYSTDTTTGSDGTWNDLETIASTAGNGQVLTFTDFTPVSAVGWRININGNGSNTHVFAEVQFYEAGTPTDMTLRDAVTVLDVADPSDISMYAVVTELNSADASANVLMRVSIDNGSTFTTAAVADQEWTFGSDKLLRFDADVSGQTGDDVIWELTTDANERFDVKEVRGVAIYA